jgi:DNA-binding NtrC family response regulator
MKNGAVDYLEKPFKHNEALNAVKRCFDADQSQSECPMISSYESKPMKEFVSKLNKVAKKNVSIMLLGESGVGKEVAAREAHHQSERRDGSFVAINCPAIPSSLFESELFGAEKGSYTGCTSLRLGKFELAHKGTIFLDEIGDLSIECQSKVLRVLQEKEIDRLGGNKPIKVDVKVICASSKNLRKMVAEGTFRSDLLYRIADVELMVPPLRERMSEISTLVECFALEYSFENNEPVKKFAKAALTRLKEYRWPGNIRELKSFVRRILILNDESVIDIDAIKSDYLFSEKVAEEMGVSSLQKWSKDAEGSSLEDIQKSQIKHVLNSCHYNVTTAAKELNIGRSTLYRKMKKYKIT